MERISFNRNLKRISLLVVEHETTINASFVPNLYEIILGLSLVSAFFFFFLRNRYTHKREREMSAFEYIEIADCLGIGVSDGLFHKLW